MATPLHWRLHPIQHAHGINARPSTSIAPKTPVASKKRAHPISTHRIFRAESQSNLGIEQTFSGAVRVYLDGSSGGTGNGTILARSARLSGRFCFE
jgi:hypothetical protein